MTDGPVHKPWFEIRPEAPGDIVAIHALNCACFPSDDEARLVDLLRDAGRLTASLVAVNARKVIGHVAFSPVMAENGATGAGLAPLAVAESLRRQGVAAALVRAGLETCRAARIAWVVVLGEPEYYGRFGFRPASAFGLSDEYGGGEAFQALAIVPGGVPTDAGLVRYAPEFGSLSG
jgi:putative acetyltransferase